MPFNITTYGEGTASSSVLEYFGLEEVKKYVYFSLTPHNFLQIYELNKKSLNYVEDIYVICM